MKKQMVKVRKDEFDIAKAIAIWMVVAGHLYSNVQNNTINFIQFSHMPIFFFISGYFLFRSTQKCTLLEICLKKTKSLLAPYFVWSMISFVANILFTINEQI
ncbi:MAG: acyltransferase family protein [Lachnospiraceae bacterium]|nr:acyltransferase family protein [Lachnospiraceae bacterium]